MIYLTRDLLPDIFNYAEFQCLSSHDRITFSSNVSFSNVVPMARIQEGIAWMGINVGNRLIFLHSRTKLINYYLGNIVLSDLLTRSN